jgi:N6-L-threonylcarbamoyladenine synthase
LSTQRLYTLLALESSCDETAAAVVRSGEGGGALVLSDVVRSQVALHAKWGGVVPEIASRNHLVDISPVIDEAMGRAGVGWGEVDAVAVTQGPGLVGALLVGLQVAKSMAYAHQKPLIPVNHLLGHLSAVALYAPGESAPALPPYPHLALVVSGGHTAIYRVEGPERARLVCNTCDDAAGEAFDKVARMLGLGYPGGPVIEREARLGDDRAHRFTMPRLKGRPLDFSFSGLKTAVLTVIKERGALPEGQAMRDLVASFQRAAVAQLVDRCLAALDAEGLRDLTLAGGVACNTPLREALSAAVLAGGGRLYAPPRRWCTDNAAMIGAAALYVAPESVARGPSRSDLALNALSSWPVGVPSPNRAAPPR